MLKWIAALIVAVLITCSASSSAQAPPLFELRSDPWMNLHHLLYHTARATRLADKKLHGRVAVAANDLQPSLENAEHATWQAAIDGYMPYAAHDLLFDTKLNAVKQYIMRGEEVIRAHAGSEPMLRALVAAMPIYRKYFWQQHDRMNQAFIARQLPLLEAHGAAVARYLSEIYESEWNSAPIEVDVVVYANWAGAYTSHTPNIIVIGSTDERHSGWRGFEILFHETAHTLPLGENIQRYSRSAADAHKIDEDRLWHSYIFYASGSAVRLVAEDYESYAEANGLWRRGNLAIHKQLLDTHFENGSLQEQFERMHSARIER